MMKLAIFGSRHQDTHLGQLKHFFETLLGHGEEMSLMIEERFYTYIAPLISDIDWDKMTVFVRPTDTPDMALSIGGDGTFLRVAKVVGRLGTPILGINTGHLGYLSAASIDDIDAVVDDIINCNYRVEGRSMIKVTSDSDELRGVRFALNEVAVLRRDTASMINIDANLCGEQLASYRGDGLIVSTPTGSTGYNLSAGGPLVAPGTPCWIIVPIAPHSLNMRPLVVSDQSVVELQAQARSETMLLSIDGKATVLPISARIKVERATYKIYLVQRGNQSFINTIRTKLLWGAGQQ